MNCDMLINNVTYGSCHHANYLEVTNLLMSFVFVIVVIFIKYLAEEVWE